MEPELTLVSLRHLLGLFVALPSLKPRCVSLALLQCKWDSRMPLTSRSKLGARCQPWPCPWGPQPRATGRQAVGTEAGRTLDARRRSQLELAAAAKAPPMPSSLLAVLLAALRLHASLRTAARCGLRLHQLFPRAHLPPRSAVTAGPLQLAVSGTCSLVPPRCVNQVPAAWSPPRPGLSEPRSLRRRGLLTAEPARRGRALCAARKWLSPRTVRTMGLPPSERLQARHAWVPLLLVPTCHLQDPRAPPECPTAAWAGSAAL